MYHTHVLTHPHTFVPLCVCAEVNTGVYNKSYQVYEGDQKTELLTNAKKEHSLLHMRYVARNGSREAKEDSF
jgi:hypothetical protein